MLSMEETYRAHSQTVYRYLLSLTRNAEFEELTQETFLSGDKKRGAVRRQLQGVDWRAR